VFSLSLSVSLSLSLSLSFSLSLSLSLSRHPTQMPFDPLSCRVAARRRRRTHAPMPRSL
jgi:hypothetical protein